MPPGTVQLPNYVHICMHYVHVCDTNMYIKLVLIQPVDNNHKDSPVDIKILCYSENFVCGTNLIICSGVISMHTCTCTCNILYMQFCLNTVYSLNTVT